MDPNCSTEVITPTGKFTFHKNYNMSICEAKKFCAKKGEILAPITNEEDALAIYETMHAGAHAGCWFHYGDFDYFIGLDVTPCGKGKQDRVFTNGEVWNETVHGKLYIDNIDSWNKPCVFASMTSDFKRPFMGYWGDCYQSTDFRLICLKPAIPTKNISSDSCSPSSSESLKVAKTTDSLFTMGFIGFLALAAVFFAFVATKYFKKYRDVEEKHAEVKKDLCLSNM